MVVDRLVLEEIDRAPAHGYAVSRALARRGANVARSSVHSALRRLERDSLRD